MIENSKKKIEQAEQIGELDKEIYFYEGSLSALEAVMGELKK